MTVRGACGPLFHQMDIYTDSTNYLVHQTFQKVSISLLLFPQEPDQTTAVELTYLDET